MSNNKLPQDWKWVKLKEISESIQYGYTESSSKEIVGPKFLRITDIQDNRVIWNEVPYCKIGDVIKLKYLLKDGDLVFARTGATVGKSFLIKGDIPESVFASYLIRVRVNQDIYIRYLSNFFHSTLYWTQITDGQVGIGQPNVNGTKLGQLDIPLPPIPTQLAIVSKIEELFSELDKGIENLRTAQQQLKTYRQSVLKWAFEGRLDHDSKDLEDGHDLKNQGNNHDSKDLEDEHDSKNQGNNHDSKDFQDEHDSKNQENQANPINQGADKGKDHDSKDFQDEHDSKNQENQVNPINQGADKGNNHDSKDFQDEHDSKNQENNHDSKDLEDGHDLKNQENQVNPINQGADKGKLPKEWKWVKLSEVAEKITDGEHFRPPTQESGMPFLSAKDVRDDGVSFEDPLFISEETAKKALQRCNPQRGDILIVSRGATVGRMCIVKTDETFCLLGSVILIKVSKSINSSFINYVLKSPLANQNMISVSGATAQQAIYLRDIKNIEIPFCPLPEQHLIVAAIESRLSVADKLEESINQSLQQAEALRQSILKKAFEGKLL